MFSLKYNIYCLQDTHFTSDIENDVRNLLGFQCYFSSFASNSRGVAILINNNFDFKFIYMKGDTDGNYLLLKMCIDSHEVILCNIYGPNVDSSQFFFKYTDTC